MNFCSSQLRCGMVLLLTSFVFIFCTTQRLIAQPAVLWSKNFGGTANELAVKTSLTSDGGYFLTSASNSSEGMMEEHHGKYDIVLTKINTEGEAQWHKSFGGSQQEYPSAICATTDGNYLIAGHSYSEDGDVTEQAGKGDAWLIKVNAEGEMLWQKTYGGAAFDAAYAVTNVQAGGYMMVGVTYSAGPAHIGKSYGGADYWVLRLDENGEVLWRKTYGGVKMDVAYSIVETTDGAFVIAGNSLSFPATDNTTSGLLDCWVIQIDANGTIQWAESYGGFAANKKPKIVATADGGFALTGNYPVLELSNEDESKYYENFWLLKLNSEGTKEWQQNYGGKGYEHANSLQQTIDGGFILAGYAWSESTFVAGQAGVADFYVLKLDATGNLEWHQNYGGTAYDEAQDILIDHEGDYLVAGTSRSSDEDVLGNAGAQDIWVMKLKGPFQLVADLGEDLVSCPNGEVELNAYLEDCGNCSYLWNDANEEAIRWVSPTTTTLYQVTITDANGNTTTDEVQISVASPISFEATVSATSCADTQDGKIELALANADNLQFAWSNNINTPDNTNIAAGSYTLVITDEHNCETTETFEVLAPAALTVEASEQLDVSCHEGLDGRLALNVAGGTGAYNYYWSNGATTQQIEALAAGSYSVSITDAKACEINQSFEISEPSRLQLVETLEPISCSEESDGAIYLTVMGGTAPYQYQWSNGTNEEALFDLGAGEYEVSITDQQGCVEQLAIELEAPAALSVALSLESVTGAGQNGSIFVDQVTGGTPPYEVSVEKAGEILTAPYTQLAAGNYWLRVVDQQNCIYEEEVVLDFTQGGKILMDLEDFLLYPNPSSGNFVLKLAFAKAQAFDLHIYNAVGQLVLRQTYDAIQETKIHQDLTSFERGTYLIVVQNEQGKMSQRIVLQ